MSCFVIEELRHRRAVSGAYWFFFFQLENCWGWLFIYLQHYFFLVDFHSFLNIQIYKTVPGCLKQWEQFTRGALNPGKFFASFVSWLLWQMTQGSYGQRSSFHQSPDVRTLVMMVLPDVFILIHSSRTLLLEPGDDSWEFCQNFATETAGLCL